MVFHESHVNEGILLKMTQGLHVLMNWRIGNLIREIWIDQVWSDLVRVYLGLRIFGRITGNKNIVALCLCIHDDSGMLEQRVFHKITYWVLIITRY